MSHLPNPTQSKILLLPFELWSTIFQHACPTSDVFLETPIQTPPFHLVLRLVSTSWFDIVQSTPQLWAFIFLPEMRAENVDMKGQYLRLCLENSGSLPLTLYFEFDQELRGIGSFISPTVDTTLERMIHRIRVLRISRPPCSWMEKLIPKMLWLAQIHVDNVDPQSQDQHAHHLFLPKTDNLKRMYIFYRCLFDIRFDGVAVSLTRVDLFQSPLDCAMEILLRCPNLIAFVCLFPFPASKVTSPRTMFTSPLVLSHLSSFTWCTSRVDDRVCEWDTVLFEHLHFPSLKSFHWFPGVCSAMDDTPLALPLSTFPKSVTCFELAQFDHLCRQGTLRLNNFLSFTGVTQLELPHCHIEEVFPILTHGADQSGILFPRLTFIGVGYQPIQGEPLWPVFGPESGHQVVQMLRSRVSLVNGFELVVDKAHLTRRWDEEAWRALRELKKGGFNLTIVEYDLPITI